MLLAEPFSTGSDVPTASWLGIALCIIVVIQQVHLWQLTHRVDRLVQMLPRLPIDDHHRHQHDADDG